MWYSYEEDVLLDGQDHMLLQGYSLQQSTTDVISNHEKILAGEGFNMSSIVLATYCYYLNPYVGWWAVAEVTSAAMSSA